MNSRNKYRHEIWTDSTANLCWVLRRRWEVLEFVPERWGWHTVEWCSFYRGIGSRGAKWRYPLISKQSVCVECDELEFRRRMAECAAVE